MFDAQRELETLRAKLPPLTRRSALDPYREQLLAMRDAGARPRELSLWLAEKGVKRTPTSVSAYLRRK